MVFLNVGLLALAVGKLCGGSFSNLGATTVRSKWLAFVAIGLQLAAFPTALLPWTTPTPVAKGLWLASYVLLVAMLVRNRALRGVWLIAAGIACNLAAILANGGLMPVRRSAEAAAGRSYRLHDNSILLPHPRLALLIDRWAVPRWIPLGNVFSVGDVLIAAGTFLVVVLAMRRPGLAAGAEAGTGAEARTVLTPAEATESRIA